MLAQFEISLEDVGIDPKNIHDLPYIAIVRRNDVVPSYGKKSIAIVNPYGVTYVDADGMCSYSDTEWFKENYLIMSMDEEITLTFRNN